MNSLGVAGSCFWRRRGCEKPHTMSFQFLWASRGKPVKARPAPETRGSQSVNSAQVGCPEGASQRSCSPLPQRQHLPSDSRPSLVIQRSKISYQRKNICPEPDRIRPAHGHSRQVAVSRGDTHHPPSTSYHLPRLPPLTKSFLRPDSPLGLSFSATVLAPDFSSLQQRSHHYPSVGSGTEVPTTQRWGAREGLNGAGYIVARKPGSCSWTAFRPT